MNPNTQELIGGYLDEVLSPNEQAALGLWLKESPENARQFARAVLLHDRLQGEVAATALLSLSTGRDSQASPALNSLRRLQKYAVAASVAVAALVAIVFIWKGIGESSASAAVAELNRIIAVNSQPADRTFQITVEETVLPQPPNNRPPMVGPGRPPKPPIDGALLHVRERRQFVLVRMTADGLPFVTGSNGQTSWAVRPDGPVRVSSDLTRFSHDLPGHEHSMPLISIQDGLEQLLAAYEMQLLPVESQKDKASPDEEPSQMIVAVKKRGYRGPKQVEITYAVRSGLIRQIRFVEMPYGPERLTLRLTLVEDRYLGGAFFDHTSHHEPNRQVEFEE